MSESFPTSHFPLPTFITFEGPEGGGKSTQLRAAAAALNAAGVAVMATREPGGTAIGEQIRGVLLQPENRAMLAETELLLYLAARAQHTAEVIRPALEANITVLCDRYSDSTLAYQGFGHGLPLAEVERMDAFATGGLRPCFSPSWTHAPGVSVASRPSCAGPRTAGSIRPRISSRLRDAQA